MGCFNAAEPAPPWIQSNHAGLSLWRTSRVRLFLRMRSCSSLGTGRGTAPFRAAPRQTCLPCLRSSSAHQALHQDPTPACVIRTACFPPCPPSVGSAGKPRSSVVFASRIRNLPCPIPLLVQLTPNPRTATISNAHRSPRGNPVEGPEVRRIPSAVAPVHCPS